MMDLIIAFLFMLLAYFLFTVGQYFYSTYKYDKWYERNVYHMQRVDTTIFYRCYINNIGDYIELETQDEVLEYWKEHVCIN